jgi:hypothetical protein
VGQGNLKALEGNNSKELIMEYKHIQYTKIQDGGGDK